MVRTPQHAMTTHQSASWSAFEGHVIVIGRHQLCNALHFLSASSACSRERLSFTATTHFLESFLREDSDSDFLKSRPIFPKTKLSNATQLTFWRYGRPAYCRWRGGWHRSAHRCCLALESKGLWISVGSQGCKGRNPRPQSW
jgi:hypothetical protein